MEEQIKQLVEKSISLIDKTGQFIESELPIVVQEFLNYKSIELLAGSFLFLFNIILIFIVYRLLPSEKEKDSWNIAIFKKYFDETYGIAFIVISAISLLFTIPISIVNFLNYLKITIAPRVYLIEYFF